MWRGSMACGRATGARAEAWPTIRFGKQLADLAAKTETMRQKIVATKEGGAITGEERIREKTTELYGEILNYGGRPADYQTARIDSLTRELADVAAEFDSLATKELPAVNKLLSQKKLEPIKPIDRKAWDAADSDSGSSAPGGSYTSTSPRVAKAMKS